MFFRVPECVMYIRGSRFSEIQALKSLTCTAALCVQISYLSDSNVTIPRTMHHLQEIY